MKKLVFLVLLLASCQHSMRTSTPETPVYQYNLKNDSALCAIISSTYTAQNEMDGIEFCTVEKLDILSVDTIQKDSLFRVKYHIRCTYQPAVMSPGYEREAPPPVDKTDSVVLLKQNNQWRSR